MNTNAIDPSIARQIIGRLKSGTTPLDYVSYINVGNEGWYKAASNYFDDVQNDRDSLVRFVKGWYGDGKTHVLGMLRSIAFHKNWAVSYVTAENTPLNKFDVIYSEIIKNLTLPPQINYPSWVGPANFKGSSSILSALFFKLYLEAYRLPEKSGLNKQRVLELVREKVNEFTVQYGINVIIGTAINGYIESCLQEKSIQKTQIASWLEGSSNDIKELHITKRIDQRFARDAMRGLSLMAKRAGINGILILLDEAERIMNQSKPVRTKSYGVIRDLLDNADNQGGMQSSIMYIAATPEMFDREKGFAEYDALRSRLANAQLFALPNYIDWRGVIVDLTKTPLPHDILIQLATRIIDIHGRARDWNPSSIFKESLTKDIVTKIEKTPFQVSKPRMLASCISTLLDMAEQNRDQDIGKVIDSTLDRVHRTLAALPKVEEWT